MQLISNLLENQMKMTNSDIESAGDAEPEDQQKMRKLAQARRDISWILRRGLGFMPEIDAVALDALVVRYVEEHEINPNTGFLFHAVLPLLSEWDQRLWQAYIYEFENRPKGRSAEFK